VLSCLPLDDAFVADALWNIAPSLTFNEPLLQLSASFMLFSTFLRNSLFKPLLGKYFISFFAVFFSAEKENDLNL